MQESEMLSSFLLVVLATNVCGTDDIYGSQNNFPERILRKNLVQDVDNSTMYVRAIRGSLQEYERQCRRKKQPRSKRAVKRVCYGELGCFEDSGPFAYLEMLPSPPEEINTKFYFYSTKNRSDHPLMELPFLNMTAAFQKYAMPINKLTKRGAKPGNVTTTASTTGAHSDTRTKTTKKSGSYSKPSFTLDDLEGFDELSVRVIVHGFGSACPHVWIYEMKTALMAVEDCIVICVDWENGATFPNYVRAAANTRLVGKQLAMLINNLRSHKNLNLSKTHLIGFSLGAHVSGFAGAELPGLARITGLDPAGPLFEAQHPTVRLDSTDAKFVDVIHSNGENLILGGLGSWQAMGHVDFYPNGGRVQTGCSNLFVGAVTDFIWSAQASEDEEGRSLCNHRRAYKFFIDSVAPRCLFPAFPCDNYDDFLNGKCFPCAQNEDDFATGVPRCGNMGYYADRSTGRGQLYLVTREEEPFCAHQFQLQIFNSFNDLPLRTIGRLEATLEGEGGLNETFRISEKDDSEFFAGDIISKIIVPHPALGFPTTLSLHYKSYSGWLSKGLPHWDIDKVVLTDSFGRSHSLCDPSTKLSSGSPVRMKLQLGDCELDNQSEYGAYTTIPTTNSPNTSGDDETLDTQPKIDNILKLGTRLKLTENDSLPLEATDNFSWQPILEGNSLDKDAVESSRSLFAEPTEIYEPILKDRRLATDSGRNLDDRTTTEEIVEPVLKATTSRIKKAKEIAFSEIIQLQEALPSRKPDLIKITPISASHPKSDAQMADDVALTVQLFPFRLSDLLQRAERYARDTLLPLISVQAPRFFGLTTDAMNETKEEPPRKPRYIPRFEEATFDHLSKEHTRPAVTQNNQEPAAAESVRLPNILNLIRPQPQGQEMPASRRSFSTYYTNLLLAKSRAMQPEDSAYEAVFISLPTYKPPKNRVKRIATARQRSVP